MRHSKRSFLRRSPIVVCSKVSVESFGIKHCGCSRPRMNARHETLAAVDNCSRIDHRPARFRQPRLRSARFDSSRGRK